ncbi:hypothetical protein HUJ04_011327 [Dendroctonus ponderosae]|nr:hypothetical protein HUJ04_011327 [Dendroctonus ponderosae]
MRLESMHKTIKYFYLDGKKVERLDKSVHVLLKFVRDKCVDRIIKKTKESKNDKTACLVAIRPANVESQEIYFVEKILSESCCELMCNDCKICYHTYSCTCNDFCINNSICKHIHYVEMVYNRETKISKPETTPVQENAVNMLEIDKVNRSDSLRQQISVKILRTVTKFQSTDHNTLVR